MTIELAVVISAISMITSIIFGAVNARRADRSENKTEAADLTTVIVKLESIQDDIRESKVERRTIRETLQSHGETLVAHGQKIKVLNKAVFGGTGKDDDYE